LRFFTIIPPYDFVLQAYCSFFMPPQITRFGDALTGSTNPDHIHSCLLGPRGASGAIFRTTPGCSSCWMLLLIR
ncbi:MAG: hypothetical protein ABIF87_05665, partial [Pseudomonadota bacterium]